MTDFRTDSGGGWISMTRRDTGMFVLIGGIDDGTVAGADIGSGATAAIDHITHGPIPRSWTTLDIGSFQGLETWLFE